MDRHYTVYVLGFSIALFCLKAEAQLSTVNDVISNISLDSLATTIRVLSGDIGSARGGAADTITTRYYAAVSHGLARDYLVARLQSYGLSVRRQDYFSAFLGASGTNVLVEQTGMDTTRGKYILSAHYDSVCDSSESAPAPGADDNASGCSAVVEIARVLSRYKTQSTIIYALWDQEEFGTQGSDFYAKDARARGDSIAGVLNMDMIGWDGDNDSLMEIHSASDVAQSAQMADSIVVINNRYGIGLRTVIRIPGTSGSDHASFWRMKYGAVLLIEGFFGGDFSPYDHKTSDRPGYLNLSYLHRQAQLAAASLASLAGVEGPVAVSERELLPLDLTLEQNWPNPFNPSTEIAYTVHRSGFTVHGTEVKLAVYDLLGREVATLVNQQQAPGRYTVRFDGSRLASGLYFYRLEAGKSVATKKMLLLR